MCCNADGEATKAQRARSYTKKLQVEKSEYNANQAHFEVGQKVRKTIKELGGTMPEELPVADGIGRAKTRIKSTDKKRLQNKQDKQGRQNK